MKEEIVMTEEVHIEQVTKEQEVTLCNIDIQLPPYVDDKPIDLKVEKLLYSLDAVDEFFRTGYIITMSDENNEEIQHFEDYLHIDIPLDGQDYIGGALNGAQVLYFDEESEEWLDVAWYIDEDSGKMVLVTDHLTKVMISKDQTDNDKHLDNPLMKPYEMTPLVSSSKYSMHALGADKEYLEEIKSYTQAVASGKAKPIEFGQLIVKEVGRFKTAFDPYEQWLKIAGASMDLTNAQQLAEIEFPNGKVLNTSDFYLSKHNNLDSFKDVAKVTDANSASKFMKTQLQLFGYLGYFNNLVVIIDNAAKGNYSKSGYETLKAITFEIAPKLLGPASIFAENFVFIYEKYQDEMKWYAEDDTKTAYSLYYNGSNSKSDVHWFNRYDKLVEEVETYGGSLKEAMDYLDNEMDTYLAEFWSSDNKKIRAELGAFESLKPADKALITAEYKQLRMLPLQETIMKRYMKRMQNRLIEYTYLLQKLHYDLDVNHIVEVNVNINKDIYDTKKSKSAFKIGDQIIYEESFDGKESLKLLSRMYHLYPKSNMDEDIVSIVTTLVDKSGNEEIREEAYYLLDLTQAVNIDYTGIVIREIRIIDNDRDLTLDQNDQYQFEYEIVTGQNGEEYERPDSVEWSCENASIDSNGLYIASQFGSDQISIKGKYNSTESVSEDSVTVTINEALPVEVYEEVDNYDWSKGSQDFRAGVFGSDGQSVPYHVDFGDGSSGNYTNHCNHTYLIGGDQDSYSLTFTADGYDPIIIELSPKDMDGGALNLYFGKDNSYFLRNQKKDELMFYLDKKVEEVFSIPNADTQSFAWNQDQFYLLSKFALENGHQMIIAITDKYPVSDENAYIASASSEDYNGNKLEKGNMNSTEIWVYTYGPFYIYIHEQDPSSVSYEAIETNAYYMIDGIVDIIENVFN
ncbi:MAG TPA: hypothetical protein VJ916_04650 [Anaerovoracaceae bacterium]|nr:hypothetical protein [Anaerovoracaceae bacterium]